MIDDKKTADELLFEDEKNETPIFRSMIAEDVLLDDIIQKNKI